MNAQIPAVQRDPGSNAHAFHYQHGIGHWSCEREFPQIAAGAALHIPLGHDVPASWNIHTLSAAEIAARNGFQWRILTELKIPHAIEINRRDLRRR